MQATYFVVSYKNFLAGRQLQVALKYRDKEGTHDIAHLRILQGPHTAPRFYCQGLFGGDPPGRYLEPCSLYSTVSTDCPSLKQYEI